MSLDRFKDENGNLEVGDEMRDYIEQQTPPAEFVQNYELGGHMARAFQQALGEPLGPPDPVPREIRVKVAWYMAAYERGFWNEQARLSPDPDLCRGQDQRGYDAGRDAYKSAKQAELDLLLAEGKENP